MSYISDKHECKTCGDLYDIDLLDKDGQCRDCRMEQSFMDDLRHEMKNSEEETGPHYFEDDQYDY